MTFAVPLFLIATLAAAIPVILHMVNRQRAKDMPFSTLRFLRISVQKTRRRKRVQDIFLMLLRMAVLLLIALGLARPTMTSLKSFLGGGASSAVAIILDNSASMGVVDQGRPRLETALGAALQILDELADGDQAALLLTGGPAFSESDKLHRTQEKVRQILNQVAVSYERADLGIKIQQARRLLVKSDLPNKQIFLISDMQNLSWEGLKSLSQNLAPRRGQAHFAPKTPQNEPVPDEAAPTDEQQKAREIPIILVDCHRAPRPNVALVNADLEATVPVAGLPVKATVELFNASSVAQQRHVELYVDSTKQAASPVLSIPAEGRVKHDFLFTFETSGLHRGEVRLAGEDGSPYDDRRFFTMEIDQGIPVAVVKPQRHEIPYLEETFYVAQALAPARAGGWAIRTTHLTAADLSSEPLTNFKVVYLVNLPALDAAAADRLRGFVENGGHAVWISGDNVQADAYNQMNQQAQGRLLPAPILGIQSPDAAEGRDSWHINFLDKEHKALAQLVEPASLYQSVLVYKYARLDTVAAPEAWVLARLDNGDAILTQRNVEQGSVTLLGTSGHVGWTNLPLRPIFLPLLARMTFHLAGAEQARHVALAGSPLVIQFEDQIRPRGVEIQPPSAATIRLKTEDSEGNREAVFRYADTHEIGIYLLRLLEAVRPVQIAWSVNVDPEESDPAKIDRAELQERLSGTTLVWAEDPEDLSSTFQWLREGKSLWGTFLWAVLLILIGEAFVANRLSPKTDEEQFQIAPGMRRLAKKSRFPAAT